MSQPLIVTQLLLKRTEIEAQIKSLEDRLGQARADLLHVAATVLSAGVEYSPYRGFEYSPVPRRRGPA